MVQYDKLFILMYTFGFVGIFVNGASLFLLIKLKKSKMDKTQRWIILNLCVFNCCLSLTYTIFNSMRLINSSDTEIKDGDYNGKLQNGTEEVILYVTKEGVSVILKYLIADSFIATFVIGTYLATLWLVLDRFLHIKLILKYSSFWSNKKTVLTTLVMWAFAILIGCFMRIYFRAEQAYICNIIYFTMDSIIIMLSSCVYSYALLISRKQRKRVHSNQKHKGITKGLLLSITILLTFIITVIVPDLILVINKNQDIPESFAWYVFLCNYISLLTDAVIYILLSPQVRRYAKRKLCLFKRSSNSTVSKSRTLETSQF